MLIENTLFGEINKEEISIKRIIEFQSKEEGKENIVAFSGGKDSVVLKHLIERSGIKAKFVYSPTSVDPPELIKYIRKHHPDVEILPYRKDENGNPITMWNLIPRKGFAPTRINRYCCDWLKERTGEVGDTVFLGVRWAESSNRAKLPMVGFWKGKIVVRPIIEWTDEEIWEYIRKYNLAYCELYDKGFDRIGCIGCPLNSKNQAKELEAYPKFKNAYIRAFDRMIIKLKEKGKDVTWENGEEVMRWWIGEVAATKTTEGQCSFLGD